mmetsp:Transcript_9586/g.13406  ORF Transcript_9586/g.13406 Transcript_9586/m.13406 type:complete len:178 (-) Transcript_9586:60-593(-)|eukprot:symbB.v1.2.005534.t1/scaffold323.1/size229223/11
MLRLSVRRLGLRPARPLRAVAGHGERVRKQSFGYGDHAPPDAPGFGGEHQQYPPETVSNTVKYISQNMTNPPKYKEIIEGIGYPGQKNSHGGLVTLGRIYYGPGRYDYGRPKMPKGWLANFFYPLWEFGHIFFVADRWIAWRVLRHIVAITICFIPMNIHMHWNARMMEDYKKTHEW